MRVPAILALLCWVACASAWECDSNAEHLTAVDIKIKSHEDHVIYGQLHACPRAGEELSPNLRFRFQNQRNIILDEETGSFEYSPDREHFSGVHNFDYTVEDEVERSEPASVFISLRPHPDEPRLQVQHVQGNEGEVIPLHIQAQLEDEDGSETLTVTLCNCGQEVSCKSKKCKCQLSVPSGWHFLAGGQRVHRRSLNKLTPDQANQLSIQVPENSHGQYCFGVHAITVEQKGKGHINAQVSQDMHITVHSRNQPPTITHHSKTETVRWCTISAQEQQKCQEMSRAFIRRLNHRLECVQGQSSEDCMYKISHNMADVITLDGGDIYTAGSKYSLVPVMGEDYGNGDASYWAVAVVHKDNRDININNLQGHKSCHTGIGKTSGWNVPVGWLIQNNQMKMDSRKSIPQAVGKFFSKSCVPGAQSPEYNPDGTNPESLCSLCVGEGDNRCVRNTNEPYYGYSGAFRCLVEGAGDVAFVNHVTVYENTNGHSEEEWTRNLDEDDFELLCPDGSRQPWNQYKECNLARVPAHAVMTSYHSRKNLQQIVDVLNQAQEHFGTEGSGDFQMFDSSEFEGRDLMFRDNVQRLVPVGQRNTWQKWLGSSYMESVGHLISHDEQRNQRVLNKQIRWCATSDAEMEKCERLSKTLTEGGFVPTVKCVRADNAEQCMQMIHRNQADVITLDGGDIYQAGMKYNMRPIMGEDYGNGDASYWAVAVVRKDNSEININNLRGRKSCHTGIGKTSGWIIPTGWLVDQDFVHTDGQTSLVQAVGHFFSQSCVPGAKSPEYDPQNTNPSNLCSLCAGAGEDHCVRNKNEPYYGYAGAFRCLAEGSGDVAFINHLTVQDNTDGHNPENWAAGLRSNEFELLCTDGSRRPVDQWRECSLARVPSHAVMTSNDRNQEWVDRAVQLLKNTQDMFGTDENERGFQLFDSASFGGHDLLFRDDTHHLVEVGSKDSWEKWLGQEYLRCIRSHHAVEPVQPHSTLRWCTISSQEQQKCQEMSQHVSRSLNHRLECVQGQSSEDCMYKISHHQADVITLDGGDIYQAGMKYNMRPIMGEDYGNGDASYWAVAVVRKDNSEININNLRGRKSCHTGIGKTSGWIIPTGWLVDQDFVHTDGQTSLVQAVGQFFSKSCVPGAKSPEYDPQNTNPSNLCSLCAGAGEDHCVRNKNEPYYGYAGAFRCLAEGSGDVAFINHLTVQDNTDGHNPENWAAGLRSNEFELLCTDGSRRPVDQWRECSLARVPSHAVMTSNDRSQEWVKRVVQWLKNTQDQFGSDENKRGFQMFDSASFGGHDLLFRDDTHHLVEVGSKDSWEKWLGQEYLRCIRSHHAAEPVQPHSTLRWCTISSQEQQKCQEMSRAFIRRLNHRLECVQGQSSEDCMYKISHHQADVITLDGGDVLTAGSKYDLVPVMGEDYGNGDASYWAVAVARINNQEININNLQGRKSCHTGISKTSGWNVPVGWLIQHNQMKMDSKKSIPQAVGKFFSKSCVPGAQSPEYNPDGTNPESLCSLCVGEGENRCVRNTNEPYYGYSGAFRCLAEGAGDVAFVNHQTIFENTNGRSEEGWTRNLHENDFELLCPDGSRKQWNQWKECNLARVPSHAVMTSPRSRSDLQQIVDILIQAQEHFGKDSDFQMFDSSKFGGRDLMFRDNVQRLVPVGQRNTWQKWLGSSYLTSVRSMIHRDEQRTQHVLEKQVRWCVTSQAEQEKCEQMSTNLDTSDFVTFPTIKCVHADNAEQCMQKIHMNQADVITLDGGDIFQAGSRFEMKPILGEDYGNGDASYWAVAVVRKDDSEININNLRGRKSCHTGIGKTSGWIIPTGWLVDQDFVHTDGQTSLVQAVGHFFSQSCVPGAKSPEYDPQNTNPSNLCSLCAGAGEDHCVRNKNEPYYGYAGAFRCLAEGSGDVAFINHLTVQDNTDGHNPENWAAGLRSNEFELLCTDGSRRPVDQWRECSLARVPSHAVMTSNDRSQEWVNRVVRLLKGAQDMFGTDENERDFQMFDSASFGGHDLLFRDDTHHLVEVGSKDSWEKWLGQEYLRCIRSHHAVEHHDMHSMRSSGQQPALSTSEGRPVLLSNLRIQDAEGHNGRYHVHATVNQGGHLWIRDGLDGVVFTSDAKTTNKHHARHHRHQDPHQHQEESHPVESELSWEDSSSQEDSRSQSHESQSHESQSHERNHQDSNPISHLWDSLWQMWDENSSEEKHHSSEEGQRRHHSSEEGQHRHSSEESHQDRTWDDVHTSTETKRQELTKDDDFYQHYKHHHFQYSNNGRPTLSFSGDLASVQKAVSSMVFVPWCEQWPTPPNWDLPPTTWMFPSEEDQDRSEDPNHPVIWPAWYPRFWYPFPTKAWTWWPRVLPPYWLNKQCQDWTSMIHISVSEEAPSSCASQQDRQDRPVTDMDIPVHVQSRTNAPISLIPRNLFYYFASDAESVPINDIYIRSELTDVNLRLNFKVMENHLATVQAESVEAPEFTCTSVEECNEHLRTVKVHFKNGVTATDFCHLGIQISMFKDNSDVPSDLLTVWAYQTSGQCVDPWATNGNFHLSKERSQTNQGQTVDINLIPDDLSNEESLNGILHVTIRAAHGLVTYTAPDGLRTFIDHMGVHQRIPTNICVSGPAEMVKQALQTIKYTPIRAFTGTDNITIEYGTTRTAMRLSPDKIHRKMTVVHKVEVRPVSSPILVQAPSHMCVHRQQRPLPHIDTNLKLQSLWHKPTPNMVKLTVTATSGDVNINEHKLQEQFHPHQNSEEHHRDMVHLDLDVQHRQRASGSWLQVVAEDWVVRHILHNQLVWYKPNKCVSSGQPIRHDTVHVEVEEVSSEHVTNSEIQVTVDCHQNQQQRWQVDGVSSEENSRGSHESRGVSSQWSLELSPWSVEQSSTEVEVTSDTECVPAGSWKEWSECNANSCQMGSQWRERPTRNSNPASNRYCQPQREQRQCTNCGCKPERQFVKHPSPSFQNCQTVRQVLRCPETCKPTKTSFVEEQFNCRGRTLSKDVLVHEACACVECAAKHTKESWHSSERQPSSNERWSEELGFPWY
ncbi:LTF [Branchiostoma lanceolatum]|uniref:Serotransferrin n=1 Tax=Branchiostoma lanceolatum TaxID=7740 RepID=A0A8K0A079_BRALA|nr:LTF [Branchiostoma lanceolatum]